ncbi:MAG: response regulator [Elusimicrobia bacterium]|nr:response regulator [Elusimicrobiota bacterium]
MALIAVVDDDAAFGGMLSDFLSARGHEPIAFSNGQEALDYVNDASKRLPRLILLDVMMPGMDGYTVYSKLQEGDRTRRIPIIVLTAKGRTRSLFESSLKVAAFLEKPVDLPNLERTIVKALGG